MLHWKTGNIDFAEVLNFLDFSTFLRSSWLNDVSSSVITGNGLNNMNAYTI